MSARLFAAILALCAPLSSALAEDTTASPHLMDLPPALQAQLHDVVLAGAPSRGERLQRLSRFMLDPQGLNLQYDENATNTVAQSYATRRTNCLAFTMMFLALAEEAGLDAYPQEIGETLSWRESGGTIFRDNHVNAGIRIGGRHFTMDVAGDGVFGLKPPVPVSNQRLFAHYYNNLAIAAFEHGDLVDAQREMDIALTLDPAYAPHWSNAGVLRLRAGDVAGAQDDYRKALALDPENASALFNMTELMHRTGDRREASYRQQLARVQQKDPLQHFVQALDYERAGDYPHAIEHYRRAIALFGSEHRFYSALARAYLLNGDPRRASRALRRAEYLSHGQTRAAYRQQREQLRDTTTAPTTGG